MTTTLYLPRRHRRPLLFPPGLMALAWLLWLGCAALPQMQVMHRPQVVIPLTMIPNDCASFDFIYCYDRPLPPLLKPNCLPLEKLEAFRSWQNIIFTGNRWADYFGYQQVQAAILRVQKNEEFKLSAAGLRVYFSSGATYNSLIYSLDELNSHGIKAYWLDIYQLPTILYAFTPKLSDEYNQWRKGALCDYPMPK